MRLQKWLCWCMRFVLPFFGWRVPVALLRGPARGSGREVVLLSAGAKSDFIMQHWFAQEPVAERSRRVPIWRLQRLLDEWRAEADLVAVQVDRVSARLFLRGPHISVPLWVDSYMQIPADWQAFICTNQRAQSDIRRVRIKQFESHFSRDEADFDLFYERFYQPYVQARHQDRAEIVPRWRLWVLFKQGMQMHWISRGGEKLAASIVQVEGRRFHCLVNGLRDGRQELMKEGALSAQYVCAIMEARRLGCTELRMGGSLPSLHDGVFRYKSKWTTGLSHHVGIVSGNLVTRLSWQRLAGPVAEFLSHTSIIHHDHAGYSALWAFPEDMPLTAENLQQQYGLLKARGLHRFRILLTGGVPVGYVCPDEVSLIPMSAVQHGGPEVLAAYIHEA
jgi:hypothetical protein